MCHGKFIPNFPVSSTRILNPGGVQLGIRLVVGAMSSEVQFTGFKLSRLELSNCLEDIHEYQLTHVLTPLKIYKRSYTVVLALSLGLEPRNPLDLELT